MTAWRNKLMEQIEPETTYNKFAEPLRDLPRHFWKKLPPEVSGRELLVKLLRYHPCRGRPPVKVRRDRRVQMRCSSPERQFLERVARLYAVDVSLLIRACCLGRPALSPFRPIHLECVFALQMLKALLEEEAHDLSHDLTTAVSLVNRLEVIKPPEMKRHRIHRVTVRFTEEEYAGLRFDGFTAFLWSKICSRIWYASLTINPAFLYGLQAILEGVNACDSDEERTRHTERLKHLLKEFLGGSYGQRNHQTKSGDS